MELLPCPFCGGEALPTAHLTYNWFAPVCRRCNARGPSVKIERDSDPQEMRNLMNQADENWNRRASPASATEGWEMQNTLMKFDPATGEERPYPSHAAQWREWHGVGTAWLFDPWTGRRRDARDVGSDVHGLLIVPAGTLGMDMGGCVEKDNRA